MRKNSSILLVVILLAIITAAGIYAYLFLGTDEVYVLSVSPDDATTKNFSLNSGQLITDDMFNGGKDITINDKTVTVSFNKVLIKKGLLSVNAITDPNLVIGKYTSEKIFPGQVITNLNIGKKDDLRNNEYAIANNLQIVTLPTNNIDGVTTQLKEGDRVDIYVTSDLKNVLKVADKPSLIKPNVTQSDDTYTYTKLLLQNVYVLQTNVTAKKETSLSSITLAVSPDEVELLKFCQEKAKLAFTLLPNKDLNNYTNIKTSGADADKMVRVMNIFSEMKKDDNNVNTQKEYNNTNNQNKVNNLNQTDKTSNN